MPTLYEVADVIAEFLLKITEDLKELPRIMDKFHGADFDQRSLYTVMAFDYECQKLQHYLADGLSL